MKVYRIQDKDGRGPFKPGFSHMWVDEEGPCHPSCMEDFGWDFANLIPKGHAAGCAFRTMEQLNKWFSETELTKLELLGYRIAELEIEKVLAESPTQLLVCRKEPFKNL
jgi:hypothetical protein